MDGSCNRQFIISELHECDRICAVRAVNTRWLDHPPEDYLDVESFKEWLWLNSAYTTEVAGMETINQLIRRGSLQSPDFKTIDLVEVQIPLACGPFQQLYEKQGVYELALGEAMSGLRKHAEAAAALAGSR